MTTISNTTSTSSGITLSSGDTLDNTSTITVPTIAVYAGTLAAGVAVNNYGSIAGGTSGGDSGIVLADGGTLTNGAATNTNAQISGYVGVNITNAAGYLTNFGIIQGNVANGVGVAFGNTATNGGTILNEASGTISGEVGINLNASASIENFGHISGNSNVGPGIALNAGGSVTNMSGGTISGTGGILAAGSPATVVNSGLLQAYSGSSDVVALNFGGSVTNQSGGLISGVHGVVIDNGGVLVNFGLISSTYGVSIVGAGTVTNDGSIVGSKDAVQLASGSTNLLQVAPGAAFSGTVDGGNSIGSGIISTLELLSAARAGTLSGLGSQFIDFADIAVDNGADWTLQGSVVAGQTLSIAGTGMAQFAYGSFAGTIDGLQQGTIVLTGVTNASSATVVSNNTLEVSLSSGGPIDLTLGGSYAANSFHLFKLNGTGPYAVAETVPCYLAGTRIRTEDGEVPVEQLRVGDRVITRDGSAKPIRWIGRRSYSGAIPAGLRDVEPIAFAPGSLADGVPARELIVSPLHALYIDGVLIPAERLVNGRTIRRRPDIDPIRYFHIELERHDVIFAEGAPAESFVDCDSRSMFHNAAEFGRYSDRTA